MAPVNGTNAPHSRFCSAMANANSSRVQPLASVMGGSNKPMVWRTPMASMRMSAPHTRTVRVDLMAAMLPHPRRCVQRIACMRRMHAVHASLEAARRELFLDVLAVVARGRGRAHEAAIDLGRDVGVLEGPRRRLDHHLAVALAVAGGLEPGAAEPPHLHHSAARRPTSAAISSRWPRSCSTIMASRSHTVIVRAANRPVRPICDSVSDSARWMNAARASANSAAAAYASCAM